MSRDGYASPEEAARGDIPARYARTLSVAVSPSGDEALVVLGTNEDPYLHPYEVVCFREGGRWFGGSGCSGLGTGWTATHVGADARRGVLRLSGVAPADVSEVIVAWKELKHRVPVTSGYFFFTAWDVPEDFDAPRVVRHIRADGSEEAAAPDPVLEQAWETMARLRRSSG